MTNNAKDLAAREAIYQSAIAEGKAEETAALNEQILSLHRQLAAERLRADQGWSRYESANSDRNSARNELAAIKAQPAPTKAQGVDIDQLIAEFGLEKVVAAARAELRADSTIIPSILVAQGKDSARLDAERYQWLKSRFTGYDFFWMGKPDAETEEGKGKMVIVFEVGLDFWGGRDFESGIDAARATAETGSKP